ncbi:DNA-binding response regulator [Polaribacter reichenbachii]|uniref:LuxR family transcriptional regulator n=1 Tax=Polaribacter reichenbachii TaxID=996801 RepID=A0A1B8TVW4_9FLAO|nr:response regulator transcription factor [Polaribacter reichenbachii]APZ45195.1 DNA-binding response regulator [Polaribacter reichenbachii]AUC19058.1 DNA-binding response regulator [Polaribacter reichenbachii]OBY63787.1 LuxR family transcriptional regulator [Polaribacter reichenbachii]
MKQSIFIADDHPILIKGLNDLLIEKKMNVIGFASDGQSALNFIFKYKPDIAILDVEMPNLTGIEIAEECKKNNFCTKIILITLHKEIDLYLKAKKLNIYGYLLKEFALEEIETCINSVKNGIPYFSKNVKDYIGFTDENNSILKKLTLAEKRILKLISQHKTSKEIGHILFSSPRTIEKHRSKIITKLNLSQKSGSLYKWVQKNKHLFN